MLLKQAESVSIKRIVMVVIIPSAGLRPAHSIFLIKFLSSAKWMNKISNPECCYLHFTVPFSTLSGISCLACTVNICDITIYRLKTHLHWPLPYVIFMNFGYFFLLSDSNHIKCVWSSIIAKLHDSVLGYTVFLLLFFLTQSCCRSGHIVLSGHTHTHLLIF